MYWPRQPGNIQDHYSKASQLLMCLNISGQFECGTAKESNMTRAEVEKHFTSKYGEDFGVVSLNLLANMITM